MWNVEAFRKNLDTATRGKGRSALAADGAGIHPGSLSRWGEQIPAIDKIYGAAVSLGVSPCWLAFDSGPQDMEAAKFQQNVGMELERDLSLAHVFAAWLEAPDSERAMLRAWASKYKAPPIKPVLEERAKKRKTKINTQTEQPSPLPAKTASAQQKSAKPPLSQSELDAVLEYIGHLESHGRAEKPLLIAFAKLGKFLDRSIESQTRGDRQAAGAASAKTVDTNVSAGGSAAQPVARRRS